MPVKSDILVQFAVATHVLNKTVLLLVESLVIAGYYAWFGFFDLSVGGEGDSGDELEWAGNKNSNARATVFGLWVTISLTLAVVSHAVAFRLKARQCFERAKFEFKYGAHARFDNDEKRLADIKLHAATSACDLFCTISTASSVFAWDWTAKALMKRETEFVWLYAVGTSAMSALLLLVAHSYFKMCERPLLCCLGSKIELAESVIERGREITVDSIMVMILHNCSLLTGLTLNYAFSVSLNAPLAAMAESLAVLAKWGLCVGVVGIALLVIRFRRVLMGCQKQGAAERISTHSVSVQPMDYLDHTLIYTAAIALFEALYFTVTVLSDTPTGQVVGFVGTLTVIGCFGGVIVYVMQVQVDKYVAAAIAMETKSVKSLDTGTGDSEQDHHIAFVARMTDFVIIAISYVTGKLFYYSCSHWLAIRAERDVGAGKKIESLLLAIVITMLALASSIVLNGSFQRALKNEAVVSAQVGALQRDAKKAGGKVVV
jgi:hypothetical protein